MRILLLVGSGGFIGAVLRYAVGAAVPLKSALHFPWGTFLVNLIGSFLIGGILAYSIRGMMTNEWRLFLAAGFCGGFTTFSAFSFETLTLFTGGRPGLAIIYILASVLFGLAAAYAGYLLAS